MTVEFRTGDIFAAGLPALVVPANCIGAAGRGVALEAKLRWPEACAEYRRHCVKGLLWPGYVYVVDRKLLMWSQNPVPRWLLYAATKSHWKSRSRIGWIGGCARSIVRECRDRGIAEVAVPALGCGEGGLAWRDVRPVLEEGFAAQVMPHVVVFEPVMAEAA